MEERRLIPQDLEPKLEVRKLNMQHWLVNLHPDQDFEVSLKDGFYLCNCLQDDQPPWDECDHIQAVQQFELQQMEEEMAEMGFKAFADSLLWQIAQLESEITQNDHSADHQIKRIELWRKSENQALQKRIESKAILLRNYMQHTGKRTDNLVNGTVRLRKQQPKITVTDAFDIEQDSFVRIIPEQRKPDLRAIRKHLTKTGEIVHGTEVEFQPDKLSWETTQSYNNVIGGTNESDETTLRKAG